MTALLLERDFLILEESVKIKQKAFDNGKPTASEVAERKDANFIKLLLRCQRLYDAKADIVRILYKNNKLETLHRQLDAECVECTEVRARGYYFIILKLACRTYN